MTPPPFRIDQDPGLFSPETFSTHAVQAGVTRTRLREVSRDLMAGHCVRIRSLGKIAALISNGIERGAAQGGTPHLLVRKEAYAGLALALRDVVVAVAVACRQGPLREHGLALAERRKILEDLRNLHRQLRAIETAHSWESAAWVIGPLEELIEMVNLDFDRASQSPRAIVSWTRTLIEDNPGGSGSDLDRFELLLGLLARGILVGLHTRMDNG